MDRITIGYADGKPVDLLLRLANRHGLITGATGTGKTRTVQSLIEGFSDAGVPVFVCDIKDDLTGLAVPADEEGQAKARATALGHSWSPTGFPVRLWDIFQERGLPIRTTMADLGPLFISNLLNLTEAQSRTLNGAFKWMRHVVETGLWYPFVGMDDLKAGLEWVSDLMDEEKAKFGHPSMTSARIIGGRLDELEGQGAGLFFGEAALDVTDLMRLDDRGRGVVNIVDATNLYESPRLYSIFVLYLLQRLFQILPEAGDLEKPKLAFIIDEAHLLFSIASPALLETIERLVRLIRSKGVGVYFATQRATDVPESVLAQLGNRIQHALRAFTPKDGRAVKAIAETYRPNPAFKTADAITNLAVGEALVSVLDETGVPTQVRRVQVVPPRSSISPIDPITREAIVTGDPLYQLYATHVEEPGAVTMSRLFPAAFQRLREKMSAPAPEPTPQKEGPGLMTRAVGYVCDWWQMRTI